MNDFIPLAAFEVCCFLSKFKRVRRCVLYPRAYEIDMPGKLYCFSTGFDLEIFSKKVKDIAFWELEVSNDLLSLASSVAKRILISEVFYDLHERERYRLAISQSPIP